MEVVEGGGGGVGFGALGEVSVGDLVARVAERTVEDLQELHEQLGEASPDERRQRLMAFARDSRVRLAKAIALPCPLRSH